MTSKKQANYRLRILHEGTRTYIVRYTGSVSYVNGSEAPLALSNLLSDEAAETRFRLEDAADGSDAAKILREVLAAKWGNNPTRSPKVEVLK